MRARDNYFSIDRVQRIRYRPLDTTFDELLARLEAMHYRGAIVGPEGSGKTTLLEDLHQALNNKDIETQFVFINDTHPLTPSTRRQLLAQCTPNQIVLLDGADVLSRPSWLLLKRAILKRAAGLIVTSHKRPLLPPLIQCYTTPELLSEIVCDLLPPNQAPGPLEELYTRHHGNLRQCLRTLYDHYATEVQSHATESRLCHFD